MTAGFAVLAAIGFAPPASAEEFKRLRGRVDLWLFEQHNDDAADSKQQKLTIRLQQPFQIPGGWRATLRGDLPLINTNKSGPAKPGGSYGGHIGDVQTQVAVNTPAVLPDLTFSTGVRLVYPTGDKSPFGAAQWKVAPHVGASYTFREVGQGLSISPLARYFYGFAPTRATTTTSRSWDFFPEVTLNLPDRWTVSLWVENGISLNERTDRWFVPLDAMIVKGFGNSFQLGLGAAVKVAGDDKNYKRIVYGRGTVYF